MVVTAWDMCEALILKKKPFAIKYMARLSGILLIEYTKVKELHG
jgi:hypothetical protein